MISPGVVPLFTLNLAVSSAVVDDVLFRIVSKLKTLLVHTISGAHPPR